MGVVIYSNTCPKCRVIRRVLSAIDLNNRLKFLSWQKAKTGFLLNYYETEEEIPYQYFWVDDEMNIYEGGGAIALIIRSLLTG